LREDESKYGGNDIRLLLLLPKTRDAESIVRVLAKIGVASESCSTHEELCTEIGKGAGAVLMEEGVVSLHALDWLAVFLEKQPAWSELPVIVLLRSAEENPAARDAPLLPTDVILVERPVHVNTLVTVVRAALRSRLRQYLVRDQVQALEEARDAAQAAARAKAEFLANMSHEMRTPLAGTMGMVELVLQMDLGEEERRLLETARCAAGSLLRLINDVLDFSRLEAGRMSFERKPVDVGSCVASAVQTVHLLAKQKGLALVWTVDPSVPATVTGDEGRLRQVLINLLGNAVKFTERGEIEISVKRVDDPTEEHEGLLRFEVRDTGIGIVPEDIDKLFRMFSQVDAGTTRKYGGTGLGLALSRNIVEKMGGRMWVKSRPGEGSTFYFTLPIFKG
jgi:signal transduction histidine kinase